MLKERRVEPFSMWERVMLFKEGKRVQGEKGQASAYSLRHRQFGR